MLAALPADRCGLVETARVARYLALESAGQCGPCFNGLPRIAAALEHLAGPRPDPRAQADLERWAGLVTGRGACHHPDGSVRWGYPIVADQPVPRALEREARRAVATCPALALALSRVA